MKEITEIISAFTQAQKKNQQCALATVVHVDGSSYRRPGARMLVTDEGKLTGAISGGCLEGDALRKALLVMHEQQPRLVTYDTTDEDDAKFGLGLGCNGIIQVLIEPIDVGQDNNPIKLLQIVSTERQPAVLVTLFSLQDKKAAQPGTCLLLRKDQFFSRLKHDHTLNDLLSADANKALATKTSSFKNYLSADLSIHAFLEFIKPPVSLVVIGAGNDAVPLIRMADILGWKTTVADDRPRYLNPERFISSCQVLVAKPEKTLEKINIDEQTAFVLMTHNFNYDLAMLKGVINTKAGYIGVLGPRKKKETMIEELRNENILLTDEQIENIHSPSGLNIGAETPEEIALSILAEIQTVLSGKNAGKLRDNENFIHPRSEALIEKVLVKDGAVYK